MPDSVGMADVPFSVNRPHETSPFRTLGETSSGARDGAPEEADVPESELIRRARAGDRDAFGTLVLEHQNAVFAHAWRILKSREDAEDAAQESFLRAWRTLERFDDERPFRPWILRIATNVTLTIRSRRRSPVELDEAVEMKVSSNGESTSPFEAASRKEILDAVNRMAAELSPENAALFHLRYGEDLSFHEISRILNRRPGALAVTLHRIRERFRRALFGGDEGGNP